MFAGAVVDKFNFVHRMSDYEMTIGPDQTMHSFALQKTKVVSQKSGGSLVTQIDDHAQGKSFRAEKINVAWIDEHHPSAFQSQSHDSRQILSGMGRCHLVEQASTVTDPVFEDFSVDGETDETITYKAEKNQILLKFSKLTGDVLAVNNRKVQSYMERKFSVEDFTLPTICMDMLSHPVDERSDAMKASTPEVKLYHEKSREMVMEELLKSQPGRTLRRELTDTDTWLNLRIPNTKWCGKGNDYNGCGSVQLAPDVKKSFYCSSAPTVSSTCPFKVLATARLSSDVYDSPVLTQLSNYTVAPGCTAGPLCVTTTNARLSDLDKACRQHDMCPYASGSTMSCACDKQIRDRAHAVAVQYGSSTETNLVEALFANANAAWTCNNLERECGTTSWGLCTWNLWIWNWQSINKYIPDYCATNDYSCSSSIDEDGRLWGKVGFYSPAVCA